VPLADFVAEGPAVARRNLIPMSGLLPNLSAVLLTEAGTERARHGAQLRPQDITQSTPPSERLMSSPVRLLDSNGSLVGLAEAKPDGLLHPVVILV
jgi:hypothetical protein